MLRNQNKIKKSDLLIGQAPGSEWKSRQGGTEYHPFARNSNGKG